MKEKLVSIMERPHHLRLLHYRDERVIPAPTSRQLVGERRWMMSSTATASKGAGGAAVWEWILPEGKKKKEKEQGQID